MQQKNFSPNKVYSNLRNSEKCLEETTKGKTGKDIYLATGRRVTAVRGFAGSPATDVAPAASVARGLREARCYDVNYKTPCCHERQEREHRPHRGLYQV